MERLSLILTIIATVYEIVCRVVPTSNSWSIIGFVLKSLSCISHVLDNRKN